MTIASFKSKYIAVAVAAAIAVSLAVGACHGLREQLAARRAVRYGRRRYPQPRARRAQLRAGELARHVSDRVAEGVLRNDREADRDRNRNLHARRHTAGRDPARHRRKRALLLAPRQATTAATSRAAPSRRCAPTCRPCPASSLRRRSANSKSRSARSKARRNRQRRARISIRCERKQMRKALLLAGGLGVIALGVGSDARLVGRPPRSHADHDAHQGRRPHRAGRLLAAAGSRAAR